MKTLNKYLNESLLDDEDDLINNDTAIIGQFLKDNYEISGTYTIKNGIVDVNGSVFLTNYSLEYFTNGLFEFGEITNSFWAGTHQHINIKSLKGAPKKVNDFQVVRSKIKNLEYAPKKVNLFQVYYNDELENLKGAPESVKLNFECWHCENLKTLKGAPKKVGGKFDCSECIKLTTLEGGPEVVGGDYDCYSCSGLKNIKGVAKKIGGNLDCSDCENLSRVDAEKETINIKCKEIFWP